MRWWQHNRKALALLSAILSGIDVVLTLVESHSIFNCKPHNCIYLSNSRPLVDDFIAIEFSDILL